MYINIISYYGFLFYPNNKRICIRKSNETALYVLSLGHMLNLMGYLSFSFPFKAPPTWLYITAEVDRSQP